MLKQLSKFSCILIWVTMMVASGSFISADEKETPEIRVGVIGLDTSHVPAFTKAFHHPSDDNMRGFRVVAAYPYGSREIESSFSRIPEYTAKVQEMGVDVVESIDDLLGRVDCVLLETNDGRPHLEQALKVFAAGKPVFIDKPTGSNLGEVVAIFRAAEHYGVPMFSASSLRFGRNTRAIRGGSIGRVLGCDTYSPCSIEPSHVDLFWYGIHGVEMLFTCMGPGCESVQHKSLGDTEFATGIWTENRIGTFRGMRGNRPGYGGTAFGETGTAPAGPYDGYEPLVAKIAQFFRDGEPPVAPEETIQIYAFMQAAMESKNRGGESVTIAEVMQAAQAEADQLLDGRLGK
ncbi:Gfo/Idh/MocA family protein [Neorhodopirellula pilleata]|uniref:Oxidoreductase family, NAD-binding Rossmann fold n=1 Tax=Neorhodopirellula pilleata TaxID=2714738 RepID=A0A5C6AUU6_9BACT|nr:Gfo/Idh/MocA family oxidoreductase [Neorhodopirellula pilleata]TWU03368.1 Oxidoreductase family, NAD-binding Rossmann fold [Neorhodopirellula pilleata]